MKRHRYKFEMLPNKQDYEKDVIPCSWFADDGIVSTGNGSER